MTPLVVRRGETLRELDREIDRLSQRERLSSESLAQRLSLQQLRDDVGSAFVRPDVVHRENVWMVERAGGARFLLESPQTRFIMRPRGQGLDRHVTPESRVPRAIHFAHSASADERDDLVRTDVSSGDEPAALCASMSRRRRFEKTSGPVVRG